jgi:hypothetical protein
METLIPLLELLNNLSPLAVIALLGTVIFLLVKGKEDIGGKVDTVANNHLHELPEAVEILRRMEATLQRIEVKWSEDMAYLKGRINGKTH